MGSRELTRVGSFRLGAYFCTDFLAVTLACSSPPHVKVQYTLDEDTYCISQIPIPIHKSVFPRLRIFFLYSPWVFDGQMQI